MKVLRMIALVLAKIVFVVVMILFMGSLSTSYVLENGISSLLMSGFSNIGESIQHKQIPITEETNVSITTEQIENIDINGMYNELLDELGITEEQLIAILESDVAKDLVEEFVDVVIEDIATGEASDINIGEKVMTFVTENQSEIEGLIGQPLPMEDIEKFAESDEVTQFNEQYKEVITTFSNNVPAPIKKAITTVEKFISESFRKVCLIIEGVLLVLISLLQWSLYKWIRTLGNTMLGVGIFTFILNLIGNVFSAAIINLLNIDGISFGKAMLASGICTGVGVVLLIIYAIIKKIVGKGKKEENEVSQNAC